MVTIILLNYLTQRRKIITLFIIFILIIWFVYINEKVTDYFKKINYL